MAVGVILTAILYFILIQKPFVIETNGLNKIKTLPKIFKNAMAYNINDSYIC